MEVRNNSRAGPSEKRRAQVRQAQKAYHARKKAAQDSLGSRVQVLERTVQGLCDNFLQLNDTLIASESCRRDPSLMKTIEASLQRTLALTADVFANPSLADEIDEDMETSPVDVSADDMANAGGLVHASALAQASNANSRTVQRSPTQPNFTASPIPQLWQPSQHELVLQHPMAAQIFPPNQDWSLFTHKLYWETMRRGWLALKGVNDQPHSEAKRMFQYNFLHSSRNDLLRGFTVLLNFTNIGPAFSDGTVILKRIQPAEHGIHVQAPDALDSDQMVKYILGMLDRVQELSALVDQDFTQNHWATVEYLKSPDVESYLSSIGVEMLDETSAQLPLKAKEVVARPRGVRTLPRQLLSTNLPSNGNMHRTVLDPTSSFNPLQWHSPEVVFPAAPPTPREDFPLSDDIPWDMDASQWLQEMWPSSPKPPCKVDLDSLIRELAAQSTCDGTGPSFRLEGIHAAVNNLVLCAA